MPRKTIFHHWHSFLLFCLLGILLAAPSVALAQEEGSKGIKPEEAGIKLSPRRKRRLGITLRTPNRFQRASPPTGTKYAQLGLTIWRLGGDQSKGLEQEGEEQTLERLDTNEPYSEGDKIRLTIESPSRGFLYIVDREQYADGTYGPAILVFPTSKTRKGNNKIAAWEQINVPGYPALWRFKPRELKEGEVRQQQTAEVLTIIVSPTALIDPSRISEKPLNLSNDEFKRCLSWSQKPVQQFDVEGHVGQRIRTKELEQMGEEAADDVGAQTTYLVAIKSGDPFCVTIHLKFKSSVTVGGVINWTNGFLRER